MVVELGLGFKLTIEEDPAGLKVRLTLVDCFPARTEGVQTTPGVSMDLTPSRGGWCPWCKIEWWWEGGGACNVCSLFMKLKLT